LTSGFAFAKPSSETVNETLDFYYNGQGQGAVMFDFKICEKVETTGYNKNNCAQEKDLNDVKVGDEVYVWMAYLVPQGDKVDNILVQSSLNGLTRESHSVSVSGSIRYRTWKLFKFTRPGEWQVSVIEDADDVSILKQITIPVVEPVTATTVE
jgi:hypothetical protein